MNANFKVKTFRHPEGYTLLELLIVLGVMSLAFVMIGQIFAVVPRMATKQEATASLQQSVRAALEIMANDIRMAGYDPAATHDFGIAVANVKRLKITSDRCDPANGGTIGVLDTNCQNSRGKYEESITYFISPTNNELWRRAYEDTGNQYSDSILDNIVDLDFEYRDRNNNITTSPNDVRAVIVTLTARLPAGQSGFIERKYTMRVECRNMGF